MRHSLTLSSLAGALVVALAACQGQSDPTASDPDPGAPGASAASDGADHALWADSPRTLQVRAGGDLSFHASASGFAAGYQTHALAIDGVGGFQVTPKTYDQATQVQTVGGPIRLETLGVSVGDDVLTSAAAMPTQLADDTIEIARGQVREQIINQPEGVEQQWLFAGLPDTASGDLRVAISVDGATYTEQTEAGGLHFKTSAGLGFAYGHAVWRDATGHSWEVPLAFENGQITATVSEDTLADTTFPAVLDPTVSAEIFTDTPAAGTTGTASHNTDAAGNGSGTFLVVWQDNRDSKDDDIFGARVDSSGHVLDTVGIKINQGPGVQSNPRVASIGSSGWLVVWEDFKVSGGTEADIKGAVISPTGTVGATVTIASTTASETTPAVAGHGDNTALIAWIANKDVEAAHFAGGAAGATVAITATTVTETGPAVGANPAGDYLVTYSQANTGTGSDIKGQRVTTAGALDGAAIAVNAASGAQNQSRMAFDGTNFVVVYNNAGSIYGTRVSAVGAVLDAAGVKIQGVSAEQQTPDVACASSTAGCFVSWEDRRNLATTQGDVIGAVITNALVVTHQDVAIAPTPLAQTDPVIAYSGTQYLSSWTDARDGALSAALATRITQTGTVSDTAGIVLATNFERQRQASFARTVDTYDMFFPESKNPDYNLLGVRFGSGGAQTDTAPKVISAAITSQLSPASSLVGSAYVVAWQDTRTEATTDLYMARVTPTTGVVVDTAGVLVTNAAFNQVSPSMAGGASTGLVVWQDDRSGNTSNFDIYAALIGANGTITHTDIPVCTATTNQTRPAVAFDTVHNVYLVVWSDSNTSNVADIKGARVSTAGVVLDANCGVTISGAANSQFAPSVAFASTQFLVGWEDRRTDGKGDIFAARVTTNGSIAVLDPNGINVMSQSGVEQDQVSVTTTGGTNFLLAWTDGRNLSTTGTDIYGSRVSSAGIVDPPFAISRDAGNENSPTVTDGNAASNPNLISYIKARPDLDSERLQLRNITFKTTQGQACSSNANCDSGFCVDSKCCNTACGGASATTDCQACSVARGSTADGTCGILTGPNIHICRNYADNSVCDHREYCDGVNAACPPDIGRAGEGGKVCTKNSGAAGHCPVNEGAPGAPHSCQ